MIRRTGSAPAPAPAAGAPAIVESAVAVDRAQQVSDLATTKVPEVTGARFASGVTAIYGLSGAGKSSLADTACEYVAERFGMATMCVAVDPGGWGNRRLSLIRQGVMKVYDPRNHVNFFDTMEELTKGAWPETMIDPDRGFADPTVKLIKPRQPVFLTKCPQGHPVGRYTSEAEMIAAQIPCPTCQVLVTPQNVTVERAIVKPGLFRQVGLRIFDSLTAMNDMGLILELPGMSARGELPTNEKGGSALGSADAIRQGNTVLGTGSKAQVGFMQNRSYGWLVNIRTIPDQMLGAICTFGIEQSKEDGTQGEMSYGPAVAGKARTAKVPGWVGNCLHASKEPDVEGRTRYRLWLTNHIDPRDPMRYPYLAKHRGTPLEMPDYLEDPWHDDPAQRAALAWSQCSLKHFFELLEAQFEKIQAADVTRFAKFREAAAAAKAEDEVVAIAAAAPVAAGPTAAVTAGRGGRGLRRAGGAPPAASSTASAPQPPAQAAVTGTAPAASSTPAPATPFQQQLEASAQLAAEQAAPYQPAEVPAEPAPEAPAVPTTPAPAPPTPAPTAAAPAGRLRRRARPPTT